MVIYIMFPSWEQGNAERLHLSWQDWAAASPPRA